MEAGRTELGVVVLAYTLPELAATTVLHDEVHARVVFKHVVQRGHVQTVAHAHVNVHLVPHLQHPETLRYQTGSVQL